MRQDTLVPGRSVWRCIRTAVLLVMTAMALAAGTFWWRSKRYTEELSVGWVDRFNCQRVLSVLSGSGRILVTYEFAGAGREVWRFREGLWTQRQPWRPWPTWDYGI